MNFLSWFWVRLPTTGHLSLVSPIQCKHENKTYAAAPIHSYCTDLHPTTHSSPSPAIWKPRPRLIKVFAFSKRVRVIQKEKVVFSPISAFRCQEEGLAKHKWLQLIFWIATWASSQTASQCSLSSWSVVAQNMFSRHSYHHSARLYNHTVRRAAQTRTAGRCRSPRCHHTSHKCFLVTSVTPNNYIPHWENTCSITWNLCMSCLEFWFEAACFIKISFTILAWLVVITHTVRPH